MEAVDDGSQEQPNIKKAKLEFQQELESYMEEEKLHDIFQEMMTACIKEMPADPIEFLIEKMTKEESKLQLFISPPHLEKRIIVVTPPGMKGGDDTMNEEQYNVALMLEQYLSEE